MGSISSTKDIIYNNDIDNDENDNKSNTNAKCTHQTVMINNMLRNREMSIHSTLSTRRRQEYTKLKPILDCFVIGEYCILPYSNLQFQFQLIFPHIIQHTNNIIYNHNMQHEHKTIHTQYVYYTFRADYKQLKSIEHFIDYNKRHSKRLFFAEENYPTALKETKDKRSEDIKSMMILEEKYFQKPILPSKHWNSNSLSNFSIYLQHIFSSFALMSQNFIYYILHFSSNIKQLLQLLSNAKLQTLKNIGPNITDPRHLFKRRNGFYEFHTLYIARRPLTIQYKMNEGNGGRNKIQSISRSCTTSKSSSSANLMKKNISHWSMKFEGDNNLMTIEFFYHDEIRGIVECQILQSNSTLNRRVFWFWWKSDGDDDDGNDDQYFNHRWTTLKTLYFENGIKSDLIGYLICRWLKTHRYSKYNVAKNNCQHFIRDIFSAFDLAKAKRLNVFLDSKLLTSIFPAGTIAEGIAEDARTIEIHGVLSREIEKYKNKNGVFVEEGDLKLDVRDDENVGDLDDELAAFLQKLENGDIIEEEDEEKNAELEENLEVEK